MKIEGYYTEEEMAALLDAKADPVQVSEYAGVSLRTIQRVYLHSTSEKTKSVAHALSVIAEKGVNEA